MHGPIRDHLEELLGKNAERLDSRAHLASCDECTSELAEMRRQARMLRALRVGEEPLGLRFELGQRALVLVGQHLHFDVPRVFHQAL